MKIVDHIKTAKKPFVSFEILPPIKGKGIQAVYDIVDPLMQFEPPFIDVTYHREEFIYKKRESGYFEKTAIRKRPGTVAICAAIISKYKIDAVPHIICGGFSKQETENALIDLCFLGIDNVLVLRGDPAKHEPRFTPHKYGHNYAVDLVKQINDMNHGAYLDDTAGNHQSNFCIGVAGYPEKHFEAPNINMDLQFLKTKVDQGAEYIVTQLFFDNQKYYDFVRDCREIGIDVPIIPGLKPITKKSQISILPSIFHVDIPKELTDWVHKAKSEEEIKEIGTTWLINQSKDLILNGAPSLHYYTMGDIATISKVVKDTF